MSLKAKEDSTSIILTDDASYILWGEAVCLLFTNEKLLHEMNKGIVYFPPKSSKRCDWEVEYWKAATKEKARKDIKDEGLRRPAPFEARAYVEQDASGSAAEKKVRKEAWKQEQTTEEKDKGDLIAVFEARCLLLEAEAEAFLKEAARGRLFTRLCNSLSLTSTAVPSIK